MRRWMWTSLILACGFLACVPAKKKKQADPALAAARVARPLTPLERARRLEVKVEERDRFFADEGKAKAYVKQKLKGLMGRKLMEYGFDESASASLAEQGKSQGVAARSQVKKFADEKQGGKVVEKTVWDVGGLLVVDMNEARMAALGKRLESLPIDSLSAVEGLVGFLDRFASLEPERQQLARLRLRLADRWAALLGPTTKAALDRPVQPIADTMAALTDVAKRMRLFHESFSDHPAHARFEKQFILACLRPLEAVGVEAAHQERLDAMLKEFQAMAGDMMPKLMPFLERKLELAWRDRLTKLDETEKDFAKVRDDFVVYMRRYPASEFYPELEKRFLKKWSRALSRQKVTDLAGLEAMLGEARLMNERFAKFKGRPAVMRNVGKRCLDVLNKAKVPDLEAWGRVEKLLGACEAHLPSGNRTVNMRERLKREGAALTREREDAAQRLALGDLAFLFEWDRAVAELPFGEAARKFPGKGRFARLWEAGRDAGEQCRCSLDPDLPCRLFEVEGPAGGFEVVARFYDDKLAGVDLCQLYAGTRLPVVYRFFARRHGRRHSKEQAARFQSGQGGQRAVRAVRFGTGKNLQVVLERAQDMVTAKYLDSGLESKQHADEMKAKDEAGQSMRQARVDRITKGWEAGHCVRWDCNPACRFVGRVRSKGEGRYEVVITDSFDDPRKEGRVIWVKEKKLFDCPR